MGREGVLVLKMTTLNMSFFLFTCQQGIVGRSAVDQSQKGEWLCHVARQQEESRNTVRAERLQREECWVISLSLSLSPPSLICLLAH